MKEITRERLEKNLNFLKEIYEITNNNYSQLRQTELIKKHKLGNNIFRILISRGWLIKKGGTGSSMYKWKVGVPNIRTSRIFIENCSKNDIEYAQNRKIAKLKIDSNKKIIEPIKNNKNIPFIKKQIVKSKEISIMWGLITIKYN